MMYLDLVVTFDTNDLGVVYLHEPLRMAECGCPQWKEVWRTEWTKCPDCGGDLKPSDYLEITDDQ